MCLQKIIGRTDPRMSLSLKKKILFHGHVLLIILMVKKSLVVFTKKTCKRQIKTNLEKKKQSRKKVINYISNGKDMITHLIVGLIKKTLYKNDSILS